MLAVIVVVAPFAKRYTPLNLVTHVSSLRVFERYAILRVLIISSLDLSLSLSLSSRELRQVTLLPLKNRPVFIEQEEGKDPR